MNKQIINNILFNVLNFGLNVILGIALTPYLIKHIGIIAYGMVPLAMFITSYVSILTQSLTASVNRYLINSYQRNDKQEANRVFNTALVLMIFLIFIAATIFLWPLLHINLFISIPENLISEAVILFISVLIAFFISLISSVFSVSMYSKNRIDLMQVTNILKNISKIIVIVIFFYYGKYKLSSVGYALIISELIALFICINIFRQLTPEISLCPSLFDIATVKKLSGLGGWLILDQIGVIFLSKIDLLVVNKSFGNIAGGKYAIITQFSDLLRSMASLVGGVLGPVMMILYSKGEQEQMANLTKVFMKFMSLTMAIPVIVICVFSKEIITLWVGPGYTDISYLTWYIIFPLIINLGTMPLFSINIAMNKVKIPGLSNVLFGILGLCITIYMIKILNMGIESVALGFIFATTLKNSLFMPLYVAHIMSLPKWIFLIIHVRTILFSLAFASFLFFIKNYIYTENTYFLLTLLILCLVGLLFTLFFYTSREIKGMVGIVKGGFNKNA